MRRHVSDRAAAMLVQRLQDAVAIFFWRARRFDEDGVDAREHERAIVRVLRAVGDAAQVFGEQAACEPAREYVVCCFFRLCDRR